MKNIFNWFSNTFGNTWIVKEVRKWLLSFDNSKLGYSGKKLTVVACMYCVIKITNAYIDKGDFSDITLVYTAFFSFIAALFGINEYSKKLEKHKEDERSNQE